MVSLKILLTLKWLFYNRYNTDLRILFPKLIPFETAKLINQPILLKGHKKVIWNKPVVNTSIFITMIIYNHLIFKIKQSQCINNNFLIGTKRNYGPELTSQSETTFLCILLSVITQINTFPTETRIRIWPLKDKI